MYYAGDKYEGDNINWQLSNDKAAESIHYQCSAGIQDCCTVRATIIFYYI